MYMWQAYTFDAFNSSPEWPTFKMHSDHKLLYQLPDCSLKKACFKT